MKVRGHRIELDEIEAALARMPQVREAVVVLRGETSDTRQIVAYLVPADPSAPPPSNLLRELRRLLPEYMLPGAIVWMPALPLNASGKVDRRALPPPADAARPERGVLVTARDMIEGVLARIWREVLGAERASACTTISSRSAAIRCSPRASSTRSSARPATRCRSPRCSPTTRSPALARALREGAPESRRRSCR